MANKGPIILGIGVALAALGIIKSRKQAEAAPPAPTPTPTPPPSTPPPAPSTPTPPFVPEPEPTVPPEPVANLVQVYLKNPPADGMFWAMSVTDKAFTTNIKSEPGSLEKGRLAIDEMAVFNIPSGMSFPLLITNLTISKWKNGIVGGTIQQIYRIQSFRPYAAFTTGMTGEEVVNHYGGAVALSEDGGPYPGAGESAEDYYARVEAWAVNGLPNPDYRDITIPSYGIFYLEPV